MDKEIEKLTVPIASNLTEEEAKEYLNYLRWPETNGKPVCPKCEEEKRIYKQTRPDFQCGVCGKQFSWVTWQPFVHSKLPAKKILALIVASRRKVSGAGAARNIGIKDRTAVKWIKVINQEFLEDDYFFPPPDEAYEHRNYTDYATPKPQAKKKDIAKYILENKGISFNKFERDFAKYDLKEARAILNSIINYPKDKLRQVADSKDPLASSDKEIERLREKIDREGRELLDNIQIDPAEYMGIIIDGGRKNENEDYLGTEIFGINSDDFNSIISELQITRRKSD